MTRPEAPCPDCDARRVGRDSSPGQGGEFGARPSRRHVRLRPPNRSGGAGPVHRLMPGGIAKIRERPGEPMPGAVPDGGSSSGRTLPRRVAPALPPERQGESRRD